MLDSEGLSAVARNDNEDARAVLASSREAGVPVLVPAIVLAETLLGDRRDARANQVFKKLQVVPVDEPLALVAAELTRSADMGGVAATVDAIVVAVSAAAGGGVILTAHSDDIRKLASAVSDVRIRLVRV
ncbi:MAG: type II toxin-antitoxin system VapC family toxin [Acidimicrobiales bacterium]